LGLKGFIVVREVLVMEFIEGTPIMNLGHEMAKRGIDPGGKVAAMAKQ
jgi:aarF domain-containing kinase